MAGTQQRSIVSLTRTPEQADGSQIEAGVHEAIALAGGLEGVVSARDLVLIKPNLVMVPTGPDAGTCTGVHVVKAVADAVAALGAEPVIAEASASGQDTLSAMEVMGYDLLCEIGYQLVDLERSQRVCVPVEGGLRVGELETFALAMEADVIISVPVLKTHYQSEVTASLKNLMGLATAEQKIAFHRLGLIDCIVDLDAHFQPDFAVVDAVRGQEGIGPTHGIPVDVSVVVAGRDLVAVDATASRVIGYDPGDIKLIRAAASRGLGTWADRSIEIRGEPIAAVARKVRRVEEDPRVRVEGLSVLCGDGVCPECRNSPLQAVLRLQQDGRAALAEALCFVLGDVEPPKDVLPQRTIAVGDCCPDWMRDLPGFVAGCPPRGTDIMEAIERLA